MSTASTIEPQAAPAPKVPYPSTGYSWYVVAVLLSVYILAYIDRQILGVLVAPIKRDLDINDTQMSLLLGFAFAMFYTIVGLPIGRLADRTNRRNLVLAGTTIWSISTAFCGIAKNYGQLFVARMGVGLGEACLNPAVVPMLSDYFPKEKLGRAMGVYMLGVSIGGGLAHIVGGEFLPVLTSQTPVDLPLFGAVLPWEAMLIALGCTGGLMVALLFTVREPARQGETKRDASGKVVNLPLKAVFSHLGRHWKAYCAIGWPLAASALMTFGVGYWVPSFFLRSYNLSEAAAGQYLGAFGLMSMICGAIGVVGGGFLVDYLGKKYADGHLRTLLLGICLLAPGYGIFALMPNPTLAIIVMIPAVIGGGILQATGVTTLMAVVPPQMKSQIAALYFFIVNLIGAAVGPTAIAVLTDSVFADESMLRFSIAIVALGTGATAVAVLLAGRASYRRMLTEEF
ncbi:MFS transporter [Altererythrobacter indicus]|uniref:MFS transporter n=1 Tax=Altericroceibacterium indicum TaxID=374177 RepID=A0A845ABG3_9SPHN|nr:MFS transporter [Altericroceibacterium indicum]MXP26709.1 MFS transporter [Altericroceibacterium indicum]